MDIHGWYYRMDGSKWIVKWPEIMDPRRIAKKIADLIHKNWIWRTWWINWLSFVLIALTFSLQLSYMDLEDPFSLYGPNMQEVLIWFVFRGPSIQVHLPTLLCIISSFGITIYVFLIWMRLWKICLSLSLFLVGQKDTWNPELLMVWTFNHCASVKPVQSHKKRPFCFDLTRCQRTEPQLVVLPEAVARW